MRLPFVLRKTYESALARERATVRERDRQLARLGHTVLQTKRDHAKLLSDLRLVRTQIDYPSPYADKIGFSFQIHGAVFDGFRRNRDFVEMIAYMVEDAMASTPDGRRLLAGYFQETVAQREP